MMNQQLRDYEDPEPRVPALPRYYDDLSMPILSPPHTPVSPRQIPKADNSITESLMDFIMEFNPPQHDEELSNILTDSLLDLIEEEEEGDLPDFASLMSSRDFDIINQAMMDEE